MAVLPLSALVSLKDPIKSLALPAVALGLLAGCTAFEPETVACPDIKVIKGYENVAVTGATLGQDVTMRVNGVDAVCSAIEAGQRMNVDLGLMIKRPGDDLSKIEMVNVDVTFAYIDANGDVIGRQIYSDEAFITSFTAKSRPIMRIKLDVPDDTRVVFGLGKALN